MFPSAPPPPLCRDSSIIITQTVDQTPVISCAKFVSDSIQSLAPVCNDGSIGIAPPVQNIYSGVILTNPTISAKSYVEGVAASTLSTAESYTDTKATATLASANAYTNSAVTGTLAHQTGVISISGPGDLSVSSPTNIGLTAPAVYLHGNTILDENKYFSFAGGTIYGVNQVYADADANITAGVGHNINLTAVGVNVDATVDVKNHTVNNVSTINGAGDINILAGSGKAVNVNVAGISQNLSLYCDSYYNGHTLHLQNGTVDGVSSISNTGGLNVTSPGTNFYGPVGLHSDTYVSNQNLIDVGGEYFRYGGKIETGINSGSGQGIMSIIFPYAGAGHATDGTLFIKGGTANGTSTERYIGIDTANIDIHIPLGSGNLYLTANTIMGTGAFLNMNNNDLNSVSNINADAGKNLNISGGGASNYLTIANAGSSIQLAGPNIYMSNCNVNGPISTTGALNVAGTVTRMLASTNIVQPIIQQGTVTVSGATGYVYITIPTAYTSTSSFVAVASANGIFPCSIAVQNSATNQLTLRWSGAAPTGTTQFSWITTGI